MKRRIYFLAGVALVLMVKLVFAYTVPEDDSQVKYFYVFGPKGNPDMGAEEESEVALYIDLPENAWGDLTLGVYDPDTGGALDLRPTFYDKPWDTVTEFAVYGKNNELLGKEEFRESKEYDRKYYYFGPYPKEKGERVGDNYRFKLVAKATAGEDENLYHVRIWPENAEAFSYKFTFRLLEQEGSKMYFYPEVPAGEGKIIFYNYDLDPNGGTGRLYDREINRWHKIKDSASAKWAQTSVNLAIADHPKRLTYIITKKTQRHGNAGMRVEGEAGNSLPIYFKEGRPHPIMKVKREAILPEKPAEIPLCNNKFIFDATKSYDPQKRNITYLWDFGDGTISIEPVVTHTYVKPGTYTVKLTVRNDSGLECDTSETIQTVRINSAPQVAFTASTIFGKACPDQEITFDASATKDDTQDKLTYHWDFGDGTSLEGVRVNKAYRKSGHYKVTLRVDDNEGTPCSVATKSMPIIVNTPPLADAGKDVDACLTADQEYRVQFYAGKAKPEDDSSVTYSWDFGDGTTGQGRAATHVYKKGGAYEAKLTVNDGLGLGCSTNTDTVNIVLSRQPIAISGGDVTTCIGDTVSFDASRSYSEEQGELKYIWDFGDGTSLEGKTVTHIYQKGGRFEGTLTVDDGKGKTCSKARDKFVAVVNTRPVAQLADVGSVCVNREVNFDASSSSDADGNPLKYIWDFGDGTVVEGPAKVSHTYKIGGEYNVTLTVDDQTKTACSQDRRSIKLRVNRPPVADAGPNLVCCVATESIFDGSGSLDPDADTLTYTWDFGDRESATGQKVKHVYTKPGKYTVTLTVKDNSGTPCDTATDSFEVMVSDKPVSVMEIKEKR